MKKKSLLNLLHRSILVAVAAGCTMPAATDLTKVRRAKELVDQGVIQMRQGALDQAQASFEVAYEVYPVAAALDGLGCVEFLRGNYGSAENFYLKALKKDPAYTHVFGNLALLYEARGERLKALKMYEKSIQAEPGSARARSNYGVFISENLQDRKEALRESRRAAALMPHPLIKGNIEELGGQEKILPMY